MFEFLNKMLDEMSINKKRNKLNLHLSDDILKFLLDNKIIATEKLLDFKDKCNICYVDISDKHGFVKIMPSSKCLQILKKYKEYEDEDDEWVDIMKDKFLLFYKYNNRKLEIEQNIQYMRSGRFIKSVLGIDLYDVETFVIRYKYYQENENKLKS